MLKHFFILFFVFISFTNCFAENFNTDSSVTLETVNTSFFQEDSSEFLSSSIKSLIKENEELKQVIIKTKIILLISIILFIISAVIIIIVINLNIAIIKDEIKFKTELIERMFENKIEILKKELNNSIINNGEYTEKIIYNLINNIPLIDNSPQLDSEVYFRMCLAELPTRLINVLLCKHIKTFNDLIKYKESEVRSFRNIGKSGFVHLKEWLNKRGLFFRVD